MPLWTPARISTSLWIDFSDSNSITNSSGISQASDKSGNDRHLLQATSGNRPAYALAQQNGLNVAMFDGGDDFMSLAADLALGTAHSIFIACKNSATINAALSHQCLLSGGSYTFPSTTTSEFIFSAGSVTGNLTNERLSSLAIAHAAMAANVYGYGKTNADITGGFIASTAYTTSANAFRGRLQGADDLATNSSAGAFSSTNIRYPSILRTVGSRGGTTNFWSGEIWEILVVPRYLSLQETEMMEGYLAWKWGLQSSLPVSHPYKNAAPYVFIDMGGEVGWWCPSLDDAGNGTTVLNDLMGANNGTLTNMDPPTDWVSDTANGGTRALDFDGVNDYVRIGDVLDSVFVGTSARFSVAAWIYPTENGNRVIIAKNADSNFAEDQRQWSFRYTSGQLDFVWFGDLLAANFRLVRSTATIPLNTWTHVVATFDAATANADQKVNLFLNGESASYTIPITGGSPVSIQNATAPLAIGAMVNSAGTSSFQNFQGRIDDARIFNRILTQTEITALASQRGYQRPTINGIGGEALWICPSLDTFGNGTLLARDLSNQRNHGILTNMDVGDWVSNTANGGARAIDLDGDNDFITCGYSPRFDLASVRTVTAWIFARAYDGAFQANDIVNTDNITGVRAWQMNAFDLNNNDTDAILNVFSFGTGGGYRDIRSSTEILATNRWHFIAFTTPDRLATVSEIKLYVDGVQVGTTDASSGTFGVANTLATGNTLNIGRRPGTSGHDLHFNGLIDDVRLFHRVLSASEIAALYVRGYQLPSNTRRRRYAGAYGL